jgi:hypothetical protein
VHQPNITAIAALEDANGNFNYQGSIDRLGAAAKRRTNPVGKLLDAAKVELIISKRTTLPSAPKDLTYSSPIDNVSKNYMNACGGTASKIPLTTTGDGNCLFNAISLAMYGHERHATQLRVRTCIELIWYRNTYDAVGLNLVSPDMKNVCIATATKGRYSSAYTIAATASAIGAKITSVYPPRNGMLDRSVSILNRTFLPREPSTRREYYVMWTDCGGDTGKTWIPNHFIPLVAKEKHRNPAAGNIRISYADKLRGKKESKVVPSDLYVSSAAPNGLVKQCVASPDDVSDDVSSLPDLLMFDEQFDQSGLADRPDVLDIESSPHPSRTVKFDESIGSPNVSEVAPLQSRSVKFDEHVGLDVDLQDESDLSCSLDDSDVAPLQSRSAVDEHVDLQDDSDLACASLDD